MGIFINVMETLTFAGFMVPFSCALTLMGAAGVIATYRKATD